MKKYAHKITQHILNNDYSYLYYLSLTLDKDTLGDFYFFCLSNKNFSRYDFLHWLIKNNPRNFSLFLNEYIKYYPDILHIKNLLLHLDLNYSDELIKELSFLKFNDEDLTQKAIHFSDEPSFQIIDYAIIKDPFGNIYLSDNKIPRNHREHFCSEKESYNSLYSTLDFSTYKIFPPVEYINFLNKQHSFLFLREYNIKKLFSDEDELINYIHYSKLESFIFSEADLKIMEVYKKYLHSVALLEN